MQSGGENELDDNLTDGGVLEASKQPRSTANGRYRNLEFQSFKGCEIEGFDVVVSTINKRVVETQTNFPQLGC